MGNITIGGNKVLTITSASNKTITIGTPPELQIVQEMFLTYELVNNQWLFSLNGVTQNVKNLLDSGYKMKVQLIRARGYNGRKGDLSYYPKDPRGHVNPTFPSAIRDSYPAAILINSFENNIYKNMNLTNWMNGLISKLSIIRNRTSGNGSETNFKNNNGYWFTKVKFCIIIDNSYISTDNNDFITLNFYNDNSENINTNYSLINNIIEIYSI